MGITTLVRDDELDVTILEVLIRKAGAIREAYGFCPVVFSSMKDLERLVERYRRQPLLPFDEPPSAEDPFDEERVRKIEEESFYGQADVRLPEVEEALQETYRTVGSPKEIRGFVLSALARAGARVLETPGGTLRMTASRPTAGSADRPEIPRPADPISGWAGARDPWHPVPPHPTTHRSKPLGSEGLCPGMGRDPGKLIGLPPTLGSSALGSSWKTRIQ